MSSQIKGYYRFPTIYKNNIVFVAEDDLWIVQKKGGIARRLTSNLGEVSYPSFSENGKWIAFVGTDEGNSEVYVMPAEGGPAKRLTYMGSLCKVVGWHNKKIIFASNAGQPFRSLLWLYAVDPEGKDEPEKLPYGPARNISFGKKGVIIGRNTGDPARWKRYKGGTAGELWIDEKQTGRFRKFIELEGNLANPMWIGERVYFISDHEGIGNIYSCQADGKNLRKHTHHKNFYARNASTDGQDIVYHSGADIYVYEPRKNKNYQINIEYYSPHTQRNRKFVEPDRYLEDYSLNNDGSSLTVVTRGKSFAMANWEGSVIQQGLANGVRYRLTRWMYDNERLVLVSDEGGEDHLEIHYADGIKKPRKFQKLNIGRPIEMKPSPIKDEVAISNNRQELLLVNLKNAKVTTIDKSKFGPIDGFNWSADGNWIAYSFSINHQVSIIKIYGLKNRKKHNITEPVLRDFMPVFDPDGKYLYFLSNRIFNPVIDNLHFELSFPKCIIPYAVTLRKDISSPFIPKPEGFTEGKEVAQNPKKEKYIRIDFDGIKERVVPFPVAEEIYRDISAISGKVFYTVLPIMGAKDESWFSKEPPSKATLKVFDLGKLEETVFTDAITDFKLSKDGSAVALRIGNRLRVVKTKKLPQEELPKGNKPGRKTGWINLSRIKVSIEPILEWKQMFNEAWRLQRDYFWVKNMSGIDWKKVYKRYVPLTSRVASRSEFSDLLWEMQGELGTSHAYELGGDYRQGPNYRIGFLGADLRYDKKYKAYRFIRIIRGDVWGGKTPPPLTRPGTNIKEGMLLFAINGKHLSKNTPPNKLLVNLAGEEVQLTVSGKNGKRKRIVCIKTIGDERPLRYRDWVEKNKKYVHTKTNNRVGYIHIPDMSAEGFAEFHRYFLSEITHEALIVDVRFNGGGNVSSLLLEKLARKRLGYDLSRWMGSIPYPSESVAGPIVALTNEYAGSDGDIFSHAFKLMKLGKLIGRRTWGGVIGIWPRNWLVDGTITTQPEFSFWFKDVGWGVENYGTDPDIEVDITPQDYKKEKDTQLDMAIEVVMKELKKHPPLKPKFDKKPKHKLP
ncbi:MAG: peptidase [Candidatus Cloacimonas sp. 4484_209]|nr:MAG: peptidase [Candidatus Cloacimonas sp. 4484_209]